MNRLHRQSGKSAQSGFTLIELMVSMVLGIIVVGGVVSVLLANRNSYRTNEGLAQVQESARTAFELLARDVRQSGSSGCDNARRMGNVLNASPDWWRNWVSVQGFDNTLADAAVPVGTGIGQRVAGTDTLHMHGIEGGGFPVASHNAAGFTITLSAPSAPTFVASDILMICDFDHSAIFRATGYNPATRVIAYAAGGASGNCSTGLGFPSTCASSTGNVYTYQRNAYVGRLQAVIWYVGNNGRAADGGRSLYRQRLGPAGALLTEEIVAGVNDLQLRYGRNGNDNVDTGAAFTATAWGEVNSVFVTITLRSSDARVTTSPTVNQGRLQRQFTYLVTLRNRVS
jgi:type IV pilus assembly protein PilW